MPYTSLVSNSKNETIDSIIAKEEVQELLANNLAPAAPAPIDTSKPSTADSEVNVLYQELAPEYKEAPEGSIPIKVETLDRFADARGEIDSKLHNVLADVNYNLKLTIPGSKDSERFGIVQMRLEQAIKALKRR